MKLRRTFIIAIAFIFVSLFTLSFNVSANAVETSELITVQGAQIRTSGNAGIRFVAKDEYEGTNETAWGIILAYGEAEANDEFVIDGTVNGKAVLKGEVTSTKEGVFTATLYNVPADFYKQKVTARAYVVDGDKVVYSQAVITRSLSEVAIAAYKDGDDSEFVKTIYEATANKDINVTFDVDGGYIGLYPTVQDAIADFLADYNKARGKSHTAESFYALGQWGEISDASLFLYNEAYKTKWTWLVNYIAGVASNANKSAYEEFFNYSSQSELNAANSNHIYRIAYELRGWVGQKQYTANGNFITADYSTKATQDAYVAAIKQPTTYVYNEACKLPTPAKENHTFLGWEDAQGNPVTEFPGYSVTSDVTEVTYKATWRANYATVTVKYDAVDGTLPMFTDANAKTISIYNNGGGASGTYLCDTSVTSKNSLRWQYKVLLQYDEALNAYKVVCLDAAKASAANAASAAGVTWTHALSNASSNISTQYTVGQYIYFENTPAVGDKNLSYMVFDTAEEIAAYQYPTTHSQTYVSPEALPTPVREGYTFLGWKSSVDDQIYTEYPAYGQASGVTEVTYTAQWEAE